MSLRISVTHAVGLAAALTIGAAMPGLAQTDTSHAGRDSTRMMHDSTRMMHDSTRMMRDSTHRGMSRMRHDASRAMHRDSAHTNTRPDSTRRVRRRSSGGEVSGVTSARRIPIRKETSAAQTSGGEVITHTETTTTVITTPPAPPETTATTPPPTADTTSAMTTTTTTTTSTTTDTTYRPRTTMSSMYGRRLFGTSGFYIGVGGGASVPVSDFKNIGYDNGWNVSVPLGWESNVMRFPLGLRLTGSYNRLNGGTTSALVTTTDATGATTTQVAAINNANADIWGANADATLKLPFNAARSASLYLVGGGGVHYFRNVGGTLLGSRLGQDVITTGTNPSASTNNNVTKWGVNAGAGLEFGGGPVSFFVESRWVNLFTPGRDLRYVPVIAGITLR